MMGIEINDICSKGKNSIERDFLMELLYRHCKITQPGIGRLTGVIDYSSVSYTRKRLRLKMDKDLILYYATTRIYRFPSITPSITTNKI